MTARIPARRLLAFGLANAAVALFFDGFFLLGYRVQALDNLSAALGHYQYVLWFACFFSATMFALRKCVIECLALAAAFCFGLYLLIGVSAALLQPYFDPWY
jgi:hypothetical protein